MLRSIVISLAMLVLAPVTPGVDRQAPSSTEALCAEPYACVEQAPLTEAETLAHLRYLQEQMRTAPLSALKEAEAIRVGSSVRR